MNKKIVILLIIFASILSLNAFEYSLPKVLFITTGDGNGRGTVSDGVILALQEFDKLGAIVRLENRKIFHNKEEMAKYSIMILPTSFGYHDADRKYSLSYLSDSEIKNITNWVKNGGTLISDVYLGRNNLNGEDRINKKGIFSAENWGFADCFGVNLQEKNMKNFYLKSLDLHIWSERITKKFTRPEWTPIVSKIISKKTKILANWSNGEINYPGIIQNNYYKGNTILLASFNIIHPANDGGYSNSEEIQKFYNYVYNLAVNGRQFSIELNPWKNGAQTAFCLSFNDDGTEKQYDRILKYLHKNNLKSTFFLTDNLSNNIRRKLINQDLIEIASNSHKYPNFRKLNYSQTLSDFFENMENTKNHFSGFRFPFTNNSFWGMKVMEELNFTYDSTISVNHLDFYRGSVFPYNIPIFKEGYYQSLNLLELSQNFNDDWFYFQNKNKEEITASKFDSYLKRLWNRAILPNHGLMVFVGNPAYSGKNEITMKPMVNMVERAKKNNSWISNLEDIANYWNKLNDLKISIIEENTSVKIKFNLKKNNKIKGLSLKLPQKPKKIIYSGKYSYLKTSKNLFIIFDSIKNGQVVKIKF